MKERAPGYNPQIPTNIANLPADFLEVNQELLLAAADRERSMADLQIDLQHLHASGAAVHLIVSALGHREDPTTQRHITRGAALTWSLLRASAKGVTEHRSVVSITDIGDGEAMAADTAVFYEARQALRNARRRADLDSPDLLDAVDAVLDRAGMNEAFPAALTGLTGLGLEEPTDPAAARYGAAHTLLAAGIVEAFPPS